MITYFWIVFSTPASSAFISDTDCGSSPVLMDESSFVPFPLLVLVRLFTAGLFCFCLRSALVSFPIETSPISLTHKDLEGVQRPPAESRGEAGKGKPSSRNLGRISTFNVNLQRKFHFRASQVLRTAAL